MNNKVRLLISILFILSIGLAIAVTRFNLTGSSKGSNIITSPDIQSVTNITYNNYTVFKSSADLYGVIDDNDRVIIEPAWSDIIFTDSGKMIVSKNIDNNYYSGIIDNQDNILIPFIYSEFKEVNSEIIFGYLEENKKIVVFNGNGVPYINDEWDRYIVNDNFVSLYKDSTQYTGRIEDGKLDLIKMVISSSVIDNDFKLTIYGDEYKINSNYKLIQEAFDQSIVIFEELFGVSSADDSIYNSNIILNASMMDYQFSKLNSVALDTCEDTKSATSYRFKVRFQCIPKSELLLDENLQNKLNYTIEICMIKDRNGKLAVKNIDKMQIAK